MLQVQKISREVGAKALDPSETTRRSPFSRKEIEAYLQGALHDASRNKRTRIRFVQKGSEWLEMLKNLLQVLGHKSWMYREGKDREVYALETTARFLDFNPFPKGQRMALNAEESSSGTRTQIVDVSRRKRPRSLCLGNNGSISRLQP